MSKLIRMMTSDGGASDAPDADVSLKFEKKTFAVP